MKKIIALLLVLVLCCGVFAGCAGETPEETGKNGATIEDALEYLNSMYKADEGKKTPADYKLAAQIDIEGAKFEITWTSSNEGVTFVLENGLYTAKIPTKNDAEAEYTLTATIKDAAGKTVTKEFKRVLPIYDNSAVVSELTEGEPYKMYMVQANLGKTLFALGETQNNENKYIKTDIDPKKGLDFYGEKVEGGYKFYTTIDGVKTYVHAKTTTSDDKVSKYLGYATESDCVYYFKDDCKAWFVKIDNIEYVLGTYNDYATMCISEGTYMTPETSGISQFPVSFMPKAEAEALAPSEGPADPTELTSIADVLAKANALENKAQTAEKYLVKGTITEIVNDQYGNLYIQDEAGNKIYVYGVYDKTGETRFDAMDPQPKVGDTVTVMGVLSKYNDEPQMKNVWVQELVAGSGSVTTDPTEEPTKDTTESTEPADPTKLTSIKDANSIGAAKEHDTYTAEKYLVKGTIVEIASDKYGNMNIQDENGNKLYIYGIYSKDGADRYDAMNPQPKVGDTITVLGVLGQYDGKPQMKSGWVQELVAGNGSASTEATEPAAPAVTPVAAPEVGKTYKLGLFQTQKGEVYYFTGEMSGYYGATETDKSKAVDVTVESAGEGKYYLSFTVSGAKKYVGTQISGTHNNFVIVDEAERATFTWNDEFDTFITVMSDGETEVYMGTYGNYVTVGLSKTSYLNDTSYPVQLYN